MAELIGLTEAEARERRAQGMGNQASVPTSRSYRQILKENVFTFINIVLFGLGTVLVILGRTGDALVSVGVITVNVIASVVQEIRAKRILDHIALLTRPEARVIRAGQERMVDPAEIVVGDLLSVRPGDQFVVDGEVVSARHLEVDESLLTGESNPVTKWPGDPVYSGSFCVSGSGAYDAKKVGTDSLANQLTASARAYRRVLTPLQRQVNLVVRVLLLLAIYFELLMALDSAFERLPFVQTITMSVVILGLVPNGLFLAIATAYALGAIRIARKGVLVQQSNAIESLSNVDVLCLDKTGTLTTNRMVVDALEPSGISADEFKAVLGDYTASLPEHNRTSAAIAAAVSGDAQTVIGEVPFSSDYKWSALSFSGSSRTGTYVLGAPEVIRPALGRDESFEARMDGWTAQGKRVLLMAGRPEPSGLEIDGGKPDLPGGLAPLGWVVLQDELRPDARQTLASFKQAGVALKLISGDNAATVEALARQAGLDLEGGCLSGDDLAQMDESQMAEAVESTTVFGRITPQQKDAIVRKLRQLGHYVAMIGDGVNDVLALKQANLAIAIQNGSQAARSVADIVLVEDSFTALPATVREGQRILTGMQDILKLFMSRVFYSALLILSTGFIGGFPLTPKQNAILTFFTVGIPSLALAAWARPALVSPKRLVRRMVHFVLPAAFSLSLFALIVYAVNILSIFHPALVPPPGEIDANANQLILAMAQTSLTIFTVLCGLLLIVFVEPPTPAWTGGAGLTHDWRPAVLAGGLCAAFMVILGVPGLRSMFDITPLGALDYAFIGVMVVGWAFLLRWVWRARLLDRLLSLD